MFSNKSQVVKHVIHKKLSHEHIIGVIVIIALIVGGIFLVMRIMSSKGYSTCPDGQVLDADGVTCRDKCPDGTNYYEQPVGTCLTCDPSVDGCGQCSSSSDCNGGTCDHTTYKDLPKGFCRCPTGKWGDNCEKVCKYDDQCKNGGKCLPNGLCKCMDGFTGDNCDNKNDCTKENCQLPSCKFDDLTNPTCECNDGWKTSGNTDKLCDICEPGLGPDPKTDCSKKQFPERTFALRCYYLSGTTDAKIDGFCQHVYGDKAKHTTYQGSNHVQGDACSITDRQYYCTTGGPYYADKDFVPSRMSAWSGGDSYQVPPGYLAIN